MIYKTNIRINGNIILRTINIKNRASIIYCIILSNKKLIITETDLNIYQLQATSTNITKIIYINKINTSFTSLLNEQKRLKTCVKRCMSCYVNCNNSNRQFLIPPYALYQLNYSSHCKLQFNP